MGVEGEAPVTGWLVAGTSRPVVYLSEQGELGFGFFQELYTSSDVYSCNFHCIFLFFLPQIVSNFPSVSVYNKLISSTF